MGECTKAHMPQEERKNKIETRLCAHPTLNFGMLLFSKGFVWSTTISPTVLQYVLQQHFERVR